MLTMEGFSCRASMRFVHRQRYPNSKLNKLWYLKDPLDLFCIGNGFFRVRFSFLEDHWKALLSSLTFIQGHFLSVQL